MDTINKQQKQRGWKPPSVLSHAQTIITWSLGRNRDDRMIQVEMPGMDVTQNVKLNYNKTLPEAILNGKFRKKNRNHF